ncbi:MarR family transcriptional regulator [Pueribacillus theae]|uniref:MarR family transcriptional regulator n=2 Tax=Pueribacillus theae TaxID=2171751 RepID=A0A2U1JTA2_9BACI|nr:MarR family transcriptional regulator [Pueribacillus theae]
MFHQSVAEKVGLNLTDYKVLGIIPLEGLTAGEIASITGLSTGMVTTVVDRLEKKDFVYRERATDDRRKVIIKANSKKVDLELGPVFQSFGIEMKKVVSSYSPEESNAINDYIRKSTEVFKQETKKMKEK